MGAAQAQDCIVAGTVLISVGMVPMTLGLHKVEDPFYGVLCLQTLQCLAYPRPLPAEASEKLMYVTPFLPVWRRPPKGKEAFSAAWRSWRAAGRAGKWLGKTHQAQGGAKRQRPGEGQGVWWHYILVMLLGERRLRNYEAHREAGEKVKNTAKIDSFMATSFI